VGGTRPLSRQVPPTCRSIDQSKEKTGPIHSGAAYQSATHISIHRPSKLNASDLKSLNGNAELIGCRLNFGQRQFWTKIPVKIEEISSPDRLSVARRQMANTWRVFIPSQDQVEKIAAAWLLLCCSAFCLVDFRLLHTRRILFSRHFRHSFKAKGILHFF
jgi:hypothetical protein